MSGPNRLLIDLWGLSISAEGLVAVVAAVAVVSLLVIATRRRF
jgi:hypothetical protein